MAQVVLFEDSNFGGDHLIIDTSIPTLAACDFNDKTSSAIIVSGKWQFFSDRDYSGQHSDVMGPGIYSEPTNFNMPDNWMSSVKLIAPD